MTDEDELEKLREERKQELEEGDESSAEEQVEEQKQQIWEQAKQYMTSEARSRLANIKAADEDKALAVAQQVAALGKSGQMAKIEDDQMKQILKSIEEDRKGSESDIKFRR